MEQPLLAVVGNCASGKTTLVNGLKDLGYNAVNVPQEHSEIRRLWKAKKPDLLVMLSCTHATAKKRRLTFAWTAEQLEVQRHRLRYARDECDLYIATDHLSREEVLRQVTDFIELQRRAKYEGSDSC